MRGNETLVGEQMVNRTPHLCCWNISLLSVEWL